MNRLQKITDCVIGKETKIFDFVNLYGCTIGDHCIIGPFVEVQADVIIGNNVKVESHTFICTGVTIEDNVFIGHHVVFTNDKYPRSVSSLGGLKKQDEWSLKETIVKKGASIGSNVTLLPGIVIGEHAVIGAGSVVTKNISPSTIVAGNPARVIRKLTSSDEA